MSNNDKFIRDTEFGKLMKNNDFLICSKCKYRNNEECREITDFICYEDSDYYFAKDEPNETEKV